MDRTQEHARWLLHQLPALEAGGVIDATTAAALRAHYAIAAPAGEAPRPALALVISGVLGVALIGLGVILLLAHNWDAWSRATRTFVSLAPLALTQALSIWVLLRRASSRAWLESAATAQALAVAAAIALIGQTYHLYGNLDDYLLTCALLALPLAYVLRSAVVGAIYALAIAAWAWNTSSWLWLPVEQGAQLYPVLLALVLPAVWLALREDRHSLRSALLLWCSTLSLAIALPAALGRSGAWGGAYAAFFALCCLADARWFGAARSGFGRPLGAIGRLGVAVLALIYAFRESWGEVGLRLLPDPIGAGALLPLAFLLGAVVLWLLAWRERDPVTLGFGALPVLLVLAPHLGANAALVAFNLYAALLAFVCAHAGLRTQSLRTLNFGLAIAAALVLTRFLDSDLSYTVRGIGFMVVGGCVLAANVFVLRRRRRATP